MSGRLDPLVRRAQAGDHASVEELLALLRGPLVRQARRLGARDPEDVAQEALLDVSRGLGGYRWQASFLSWASAICARRCAAHAQARTALQLTEELERWLTTGEDALSEVEQLLLEQDVHLRCALAVATELSPGLRRAYLLGEALGVTDAVGAEALGLAPAAFRQRLARARRAVNARLQPAFAGAPPVHEVSADPEAAGELHQLLELGDLHRAGGRGAGADGALRALERVAPGLSA